MEREKFEKMRPSARNKFLSQAARQSSRTSAQVPANLEPEDFGCYLYHSLDLSAIIPSLHHTYPKIRVLAIKALEKAWLLRPTETIQALGGAIGIANILNSITFNDAKNIVSKLGHRYRGPNDPRTHTLDALVAMMVPAIGGSESIHPISRLASTLATMLIPAVSPDTVSHLIKLAGPRDHHRLQRLARTQPSYVAELLLMEYTKYENPSLDFSADTLDSLFALKTVRNGTAKGHWGIDLYLKLTATPPSPILNFVPSIPERIRHGMTALRNASNDEQWYQVMEALLNRAEAEEKVGNSTSINDWEPLILYISSKMSRGDIKGVHPSRKEALRKFLVRIGKLAREGSDFDRQIQRLLPFLAPSTRPMVLRSLHGLNDDHVWLFPHDRKRISVASVMQLNKEHGEPIMKQLELNLNDNIAFADNDDDLSTMMRIVKNEMATEQTDRDDAVAIIVRGRWAFAEGNLAEQETTKQALERWKKLVHRQRTADTRLKYVKTLLTISAAIGNVQVLKDITAWVFERFIKDVDVRPSVFQTHVIDCVPLLAGNVTNLEESAYVGDEILDLYIETMSKARTEPGFTSDQFTSANTLLRLVLWERLSLCQRHSISLERARAVISPLEALYLRVEETILDDPGTFGEQPPYPGLYQEIWGSRSLNNQDSEYRTRWGRYGTVKCTVLSNTYCRAFVNFMDNLARARSAIYDERRMAIDGADRELRIHERIYPWGYIVGAGLFKDFSIEEAAPFLMEYLKKVIYTPLNQYTPDVTARSRGEWANAGSRVTNSSTGEWADALQLLSTTVKYSKARERLLAPIIQHYRNTASTMDGRHVDLSGHLLTVPAFMEAVSNSEALTEAFFAPYLTGEGEYNRQTLTFGSPIHDGDYFTEPNFDLLRRRQSSFTTNIMLKGILPHRRPKASHRLYRRFVIIAALFWIASLQGLEEADKGYSIIGGDSSTLDFGSLYSNADLPNEVGQDMSFGGHGAGKKILVSAIDKLSPDEIQNLIATIKALVARKKNQPHLDEALRVLAMGVIAHSRVPMLMESDIFALLSDTERSSLHRHFFTGALLGRVSPTDSKRLTRRFVTQLSDALKSQPSSAPTPETTTTTSQPESGTKEPPVKISTIKYLVVTVCRPVTGFSLPEMADELVQLARGEVHPSVQQALLSSLTEILVRESRIQPPSQLEVIWQSLERLASVAVSLNEWRLLNEKDWKAANMPKIILENARPAEVTKVPVTSLAPEARSRWASMVDNMYDQQVNSTYKWIGEFLRRHEATEEDMLALQEVEFGPLLSSLQNSLPSSYTALRKYLPENSWHLRVLKQHITSYLVVHILQVNAVISPYPDSEWRKAEDGKDFQELMKKWTGLQTSAFNTLVSIHQEHGVPEIDQALREAFEILIRPSSMMVTVGNSLYRSTPWAALTNLLWLLKPSAKMTEKMKLGWEKRIRPLLQWLVGYVEHASTEGEHPPPFYNALKRQIKILLLPFPFLKLSEDVHYQFALHLLNLSTELLQQPPALLSLNPFLTSNVTSILPLADDRLAVARHLISEADKRSDVDERLLGYRLALMFIDQYTKNASAEESEEMSRLIMIMENHSDENVRLLALSVPRTVYRTVDLTKSKHVQEKK